MKKEKILLSNKKTDYLDLLSRKIRRCKRCELNLSRNKVVIGEGNTDARLMFIGEAPGADEDREGRPFIGRSGQLVTKIIEAMGLKREEVYIANILKCRPPKNRDPHPSEVENCINYIFKQIDIINPELIVILGRIAGISFFGKDFALTKMRGKILNFRGHKVLATFHPAYLLMNPKAKVLTWEDMKKALKELGLSVPKK